METIGRITVPALPSSGLTFPLVSDFGYSQSQQRPVIVHQFNSPDGKIEQRFEVGLGPRKFGFRRANLPVLERNQLVQFWNSLGGSSKTFLYNAPNLDQTTSAVTVCWEHVPISLKQLVNSCQIGINFLEIPTTGPSYSATVVERFPPAAYDYAFVDQVQRFIPLVRIRVRETAVPDIYLSDRRVSVNGISYLPRLLDVGNKKSNGVLVSQDINGTADSVSLVFGNADYVMTDLSNDTDLRRARIELSFLHINSGLLIEYWAGYINTFTRDDSGQFPVQATDGVYQTSQSYPNRNVSRSCWKTLDGPGCPYSSVGSGGDPTSCDYYFDSTNGCLAHGMSPYFGGHPIHPEGVQIKDNSTGTWGVGRNVVTATSIVSESVIGNALPEIWANNGGDPNKTLWVNAMVCSVRDESDFVDALGIIGAGPIGEFITPQVGTNSDGFRYLLSPLLDGQPPHGLHVDASLNIDRSEPGYGIRQVVGNDPQPDIFGLSSGGVARGNETAAGTAFIEIRRTDQSGIQPTTPEQHSLQVPIAKGLSGWAWGADGSRSTVDGLTNPFFIASTSYLRAIGLQLANSGTQASQLVLPSLATAGAVADLSVPAILGVGNEPQFQFQGTISATKAFRDWLIEILAAGAGYYTWEFGKLRLGTRCDATSVDSFGPGNIIYKSIKFDPVQPEFERFVIDFADVNYQSQANTAEYQDKTHAALYGRQGAPLTGRMHSVGICTISSGLRLAVIRTREEIGGVTPKEWADASDVVWATSFLGLRNYVGQVVTITDRSCPNGSGKFRITSMKLMKDYSIVFTGRTVTDSMYADIDSTLISESPQTPIPAPRYPLSQQLVWMPYQVQGPSTDPRYTTEWNFDVAAAYSSLADGSVNCALTITGKVPVNSYSTDVYGAPVIGGITVSSTGGTIPGGMTLRVTLAAKDSSGFLGNSMAVAIVVTPNGTNTNQITLTGISWPGAAGALAGYVLFASHTDDLVCEQQVGSDTPTSIVINSVPNRCSWSLPSIDTSIVRMKAKKILSGVSYGKVTAISGTTISVTDPSTSTPFVPGSYSGRQLSVVGRNTGVTTIPLGDMTITGSSGGNITVSAVTSGLAVGDTVAVRYSASGTSNSVSDSQANWGTSLTGYLFRVVSGTGRGTIAKVLTSSGTSVSLDSPVTIDSTSVFVIEEAAWRWTSDGTIISNKDPQAASQWNLNISNLTDSPILVSGFTVSNTGEEAPDGDQPVREVWIHGVDPNVVVTPTGTQDGTNPTFTIPSLPAQNTKLEVFRNGILNQYLVEYTVSGTTLTFVAPPTVDDVILVKYLMEV